jgi:[ribosomal protein S18]-alanine N-acetyltransferase
MSAPTLVLRPATAADLSAIQTIERASFGDPWSRAAFAQALEASEVALVVAEADAGLVVGFVVVRAAADEAEILNVAVAPTARRGGVGRALVRHALAHAAAAGAFSVFLEVRPSNAAALTLYRSHGFVEVGRRPRYYRAPVEDALVLRRGPAVRPVQS